MCFIGVFLNIIDKRKPITRMGWMEFIKMKIVQNLKEWRYNTVMQLIEVRKLMVVEAVAEAKELEKYVFQDDFIVEIDNEKQKHALEGLIKSMA